jgi:hypothetical protein
MIGRRDVESILTEGLNRIAFFLNEIEALRRKYEAKPRLAPKYPQKDDNKLLEPLNTGITAFVSLRQRVCDSQKQKSFFVLAKWAICDAKIFSEKVQRLKGLIDDVENILETKGITRSPSSPLITTSPADRPPPPYSTLQIQAFQERNDVVQLPTRRPLAYWIDDRSIFQHYAKLKMFLALNSDEDTPRLANSRTKRLSDNQLNKLRVDVYDELMRRRNTRVIPLSPPNASYNPTYSPVRNEIRSKLSTLSDRGFRGLTLDLVFELERRYPLLKVYSGHRIDEVEHLPDRI